MTDEDRNEPGFTWSIEQQNDLIRLQFWGCCLNCSYWTMQSTIGETDTVEYEICGKYKQLPPPSVIVVGCPEWEKVTK